MALRLYRAAFLVVFPPLAVLVLGGLLPAATRRTGGVVLFPAAPHQHSKAREAREVQEQQSYVPAGT